MPRNGTGSYSLPQPPFTPGAVIASTAVNSDLSDIAAALTGSVAADGQTTLTGQLQAFSGTAAAPGYTFGNSKTSGLYSLGGGNIGASVNGVQAATLNSTGWTNTGNPGTVPVGSVTDFAGTSAPTGWLLCFGQSVSQTTYSALFAVIGTTYGGGGGNFNLPDCRGRIGVGKDDMGGSAANRITAGVSGISGTSLGANGGEQGHVLVTGEIPSHTHTANVTDPQHTHNTAFSSPNVWSNGSNPAVHSADAGASNLASIVAASTGITVSNTSTGGDGTHNNVQPAIIFNKIIFTGV